MDQEVFIVAIVFGSIFGIVFLGILSSIIKTWIKNRNSGSIVNDEEFLAALREFKYKTDRRLANLEAIVTEEKPEAFAKNRETLEDPGKKKEKPSNEKKQSSVIEIEEKKEGESSRESDKNKGGNLRNMLKQ